MRDIQSTLLYHWFEEVWNQNNENAIEKLMSNTAEFHGIDTGNYARGASGFKLFFRDFCTTFKNISIDVEDVISQDDVESSRTVIRAMHAETGKAVIFSGICMARVENGKIGEAWNSYDFLSLYLQLGQRLVTE